MYCYKWVTTFLHNYQIRNHEMSNTTFDVIVIGAGSAGCAVVDRLVSANVGNILVLEAGPSDAAPQVKVPMGLVYMMGRKGRDWCFQEFGGDICG